MGNRCRGLITAVAALGLCFPIFQSTGCAETDCTVNAECGTGRICRRNTCILDPEAPQGDAIGADLPPDVTLSCPLAEPGDLILTEILADPGGKDPDGDGVADNTDDEFVEIVNIGGRTVALTNVLIATKSDIPLPAICLEPNAAFVLWGKAKSLQLTNGGGTVQLVVNNGVADSHTYGSEGDKEQSLTREDQLDKASAWVQHSTVSGSDFSPGFCPNGNAFPNCTGTPVVEDGADGGETSTDAEVIPSCTGSAPVSGDLVVNEILADPGSLDTNGDGNPGGGDEFLEIVSLAAGDLDLSGMTVSDAANKVFTVPAGTCLAPNQALLLINTYDAATSTATFPDAVVLGIENAFQLNNTAETVILKDAAGVELANVTYGSEGNGDESIALETELDPLSSYVKHSSVADANGALSSPGTCRNGQAFPLCAGTTDPGLELGDAEAVPDVPVSDIEDAEETDGAGPDAVDDAVLDTSDDAVLDTTDDAVADIADDGVEDTTPDAPIDTPAEVTGCTAPAPTAGQLKISEVMANPNDGAGGIDFNGDGVYSGTADEYVEIINVSGGPLNIDGVLLQVDSPTLDTKLTFSSAECMPAQGALLVFGGGTPNLTLGALVSVYAASGLSLNNGNDAVAIVAADGVTQLDTYTYGSSSAAESWVADPEGSSTFVLHSAATTSGGAQASPGTCNDGQGFATCLPLN